MQYGLNAGSLGCEVEFEEKTVESRGKVLKKRIHLIVENLQQGGIKGKLGSFQCIALLSTQESASRSTRPARSMLVTALVLILLLVLSNHCSV
mmetsp:Transcript_9370/g.16898  ORF Transcript_9370/g.16898 Transcript_9370/m.16898 type:complete len:93 (-) Transcript_9370:434-712(-)